jgi:hypothetical protein
VSADGSLFPYPRGKTPEQLYETLRVLADRLNQAQGGDATDLTALQASIAEAQGDIADILVTLEGIETGGALTPQQAFELSLVTAVDTMMGSISKSVLDSIKQSQMAAEATIRALLEGQKNKTSIRVEQIARQTDTESFTSQLSAFEAQLGLALASITEEIIARTDADSALAEVDQTITTALNGNIASVSVLSSSIDGIESKFAVTLNENGQVTGVIQLDGTPMGSTFTVVANMFLVAQPSVSGGAAVPVFSISNVNGVPKLVLRGDMIADGGITASKITASSLAAINAVLGDVTTARIRSPNGKLDINALGNSPYIRLTNT